MKRSIESAAESISAASRIVITTGAGMSKESGIPTFRDAPDALWSNYDPQDLATREGFSRDPELVWNWYADRRAMIAEAQPHEGHRVIARMQSMFRSFLLITQNIDNLHREAGSTNVIELHGNIFRYKCFDNSHPVEILPDGDAVPPRCECGSLIRPAVVWFGEMLDPEHLDLATAAISTCDVMLVVGTSGLVYPAAGFPSEAKSAGATVIEVNPEPTPVSQMADIFVESTAGAALPLILARLQR